MKPVITLLLKVLVKQFYIINAGFFVFIFVFFFGMVHSGQLIGYHKSLILGIITSPTVLLLVWIAWLIYNFKCILFCISTIKDTGNIYLYLLRAVSTPKQLICYLLVSLLQYMPVFIYSCFIVSMAFNRHLVMVAGLVAVYQSLMVALGACLIFISINKNNIAPVVEKMMMVVRSWNKLTLGYNGFLAGQILYSKKIAFAVVKTFSILLLSVSFVRNGDNFDPDLFSIFFQLIFVAHAILVYYCVDFAESQMQFSRNLPIAVSRVAGMYVFTYSILLLPDILFMYINNNGNLELTYILLLYLTAIATLFLYTAILYGSGLNMESYMLLVFIIFILLFFLQKTGLNFIVMLALFLMAAIVFKTNYHSFERE